MTVTFGEYRLKRHDARNRVLQRYREPAPDSGARRSKERGGGMTGIERLREVVRELGRFSFCYDLYETLGDIADQIEREQGGRVSRMRVLSVVTDMERHVLGHEGMEDSPVARWARELREALAGHEDEEVMDVATVRADAMEAWRWVREHGGLDYVMREWQSRVPRDRYERRRQRLLGHIAECETALGRRNERIEELGHRVNGLTTENAELRKRLMPPDKEWPRYKDGAPVNFDDTVADTEGFEFKVKSFEFHPNGFTLHDEFDESRWYEDDDRFDYPAPKVLDADGLPLEAGQTVWDVDGLGPLVVMELPSEGEQLVVLDNGGTDFYRYPKKLTHERPVLDAEGVPIKVGDVVWSLTDGRKHEVTGIDPIVKEIRIEDESMELGVWVAACGLTHTKPEPSDSWERLEEDVSALIDENLECAVSMQDYVDERGVKCPHGILYLGVVQDVLRRAKALAGVSE